jgi:hypothetical protein
VVGALVCARLPVEGPGVATAASAAGVVVALALLHLLPVVGALLVLSPPAVGSGATLLTYFGLAPFEPAGLPD